MHADARRCHWSGAGVPDQVRALQFVIILEQIPNGFVYMSKARWNRHRPRIRRKQRRALDENEVRN
jgi:hypothetical protein